MMCQSQTTHLWTFTLLVGAFLDLAIAYLLLCGSALVYFTSKFLGYFGLALPCSCNGLFGMPNNYCLQRFLVNCPTEKIYNVQWSAKNTFPFNQIIGTSTQRHHELITNEVHEKNETERNIEVEGGKALCSLISDARKMEDLNEKESSSNDELTEFGVMDSPTWREGRFDQKGKGISSHKSRLGIRRRQKAARDYVKLASFRSYDSFQSNVGISRSSSCINKEIAEESLARLNSDSDDGFNVFPADIDLRVRAPHDLKLDGLAHNNTPTNVDTPLMEDFEGNVEIEVGSNNTGENSVRFLKSALEEEHAACDALYLELEKERNAAASAADEAMAMIFRLQEEKASIEMEARQFQRMIEEKYAYDIEEMNLLKEILMRREREKHFLEKENEIYRKMILGNEELDDDDYVDPQGQGDSSLPYTSEDPLPMLQQISESIQAKKESKIGSLIGTFYELPILKGDDDFDEEFQEKGMVSMGEKPFSQHIDANITEDCSNSKSSSTKRDIIELEKEAQLNVTHNADYTLHNSKPSFLYIHAIEDEYNLSNESTEPKHKLASMDATSNVCNKTSISSKGIEITDVIGECSKRVLERPSGLPLMKNTRGKSLLSDMRRYSMSAVDCERLKIDNEVELLTERLRTVQEGREKLNLSVENRETGNIDLELLEDISSQLREIQCLTGAGNAVRQASLPPPSSKVVTNKRRHQSVPLGLRNST